MKLVQYQYKHYLNNFHLLKTEYQLKGGGGHIKKASKNARNLSKSCH